MRRFAVVATLALLGCSSNHNSEAVKTGGAGETGGNQAAGSSDPGTAGGDLGGGNPNGGSPGSTGGDTSSGGAAKPYVPAMCASGTSGFPADAPTKDAGKWVNIDPPDPHAAKHIATGIAFSFCNRATLYATYGSDGVYRSQDAGATWEKTATFQSSSRIRTDPRDPLHLYLTDGVGAGPNGFWASHDGGHTWVLPAGFKEAADVVHDYDVYRVEPDPADFNHLLVSFHYSWDQLNSAGIFESRDGGETVTVHQPDPGWAGVGGYNTFFLYNPDLKIGNDKTWLFGTQGNGYWKTTDAGTTWKQVTTKNSMVHGGGGIYYTTAGTLYATTDDGLMRSKDNGDNWELISPFGGHFFLDVKGDGKSMFLSQGYVAGGFYSAPEGDDSTWTPLGDKTDFAEGPFEMTVDTENGILYAANRSEGLWALRLPK